MSHISSATPGTGEAGAGDGFGSTGESGMFSSHLFFAVEVGRAVGMQLAREAVPVQPPGWSCQKLCGPGKGI